MPIAAPSSTNPALTVLLSPRVTVVKSRCQSEEGVSMAQKLFPERAETPSVMLSPNFPSERLSAFTYAEKVYLPAGRVSI